MVLHVQPVHGHKHVIHAKGFLKRTLVLVGVHGQHGRSVGHVISRVGPVFWQRDWLKDLFDGSPSHLSRAGRRRQGQRAAPPSPVALVLGKRVSIVSSRRLISGPVHQSIVTLVRILLVQHQRQASKTTPEYVRHGDEATRQMKDKDKGGLRHHWWRDVAQQRKTVNIATHVRIVNNVSANRDETSSRMVQSLPAKCFGFGGHDNRRHK